MSAADPLVEIEKLADDLIRVGSIIGYRLRVEVTEAREALGRVATFTEWGVQYDNGIVSPVGRHKSMAQEWATPHPNPSLQRSLKVVSRQVTRTEHVSDWEVDE